MRAYKTLKLIAVPKNYSKIKKLSKFMILIGILWLLSFPLMSKNIFASENALNDMFDFKINYHSGDP